MNEVALYNNYAIALLEVAIEEGKVEEYRKEIKVLKEVFKTNFDYVRFLGDYNISLSEKYKTIDRSFKNVNPSIISFIKIIVKNRRALFLAKIFKEAVYRFNDYLHIEEGKIYLAKKIDEKSKKKIIEAIEKNEKAKVELEEIYDPSLLGGFIVSIKDNVYDASLVNKLEKMKTTILGGKYNGNKGKWNFFFNKKRNTRF